MLKHDDIWRAIDSLARQNGLTASGLARKAGLDPTTFNKSKRVTASGRRRWPSTESVAKALEAVDATLDEFIGCVHRNGDRRKPREIPVAAQSKAAVASAYGDTGEPSGGVWDRRQLPEINDPDAYAIVVECDTGCSMMRSGSLVVAAPQANVDQGDRIIVRLASSEIVLAELVGRSEERIVIKPLCGGGENQALPVDEIAAMHRIVWAEQ